MVLFVLSLCAELIANDRPLMVSYKGEMLFPVVVNYRRRSSAAFWRPPITGPTTSSRKFRAMAG